MDDVNAENLSEALLAHKLTLVAAESCTGGMISAAMTDLPGSSKVFERGFVTYSNQSKQDLLGVPSDILINKGAVSAQCAKAMVLGALDNSAANIAVSVTGIAGPGGGSEQKPIGLVYIGVCLKGSEPVVHECHFSGSRHDIRTSTCNKVFALLIEAIRAI